MKTAMRPVSENHQPITIKPMLSTLVKEPFSDPSYVYEVKWDGYRIIAHCDHGEVKLKSRGGEDYTEKYPSIVRALKGMNLDCILDGEVVYLNSEGKPDFDALQTVRGQKAPLVYYAFDVLWLEGKDIMRFPLLERKEMLMSVVADSVAIKISDHFEDGIALFEQVKKLGLEGIVAKRRSSPYIQNDRSKNWLKITTENRQEFVVGGWIESEKRSTFRTLLFGHYVDRKLKWKGHVGGGFKEREMPVILNRLKKIEIDTNPFDSDVEYSEGKPHWVKPELVVNVKFSTTTRSGKIRKPAIFLGFREDKPAEEVIEEKSINDVTTLAKTDPTNVELKGSIVKRKNTLPASSESNWPIIESQEIRNEQEFEMEDCKITIQNVDRELWKGVNKADLIQYYLRAAKFILPYIKNRPLSLYVKPKGPNAPGVYIKDMEQRQPECADIFTTQRKHKKLGKRDVIDYLVCNNTVTLLYMINLGCIDINPWTSTTANPLYPDFIVLDFDPTDGDFKKVIESVNAGRQVLEQDQLKGFVKTSGKTGMHLFIPCMELSFPQARAIAENLCETIHALVPSITTTAVSISERENKVYLDPNQNDYTDTIAAPYCVRPYKWPLVSTPLAWRELRSSLDHLDFTIHNTLDRIEKKGDLFARVLDRRACLRNQKILKKYL